MPASTIRCNWFRPSSTWSICAECPVGQRHGGRQFFGLQQGLGRSRGVVAQWKLLRAVILLLSAEVSLHGFLVFGQDDLGVGLAAAGLGSPQGAAGRAAAGFAAVGSPTLMPASRLSFSEATAAGGSTFSLKAAPSFSTPSDQVIGGGPAAAWPALARQAIAVQRTSASCSPSLHLHKAADQRRLVALARLVAEASSSASTSLALIIFTIFPRSHALHSPRALAQLLEVARR